MISSKTILIILALILFVHVWATVDNWYWIAGWIDIPMHFLGGLWFAILFFYLNEKFFKINNKTELSLFVVSFVSLIGVLWEFYEYVYAAFFPLILKIPMDLYRDTLSDLFFDFVGAIFFLIIYFVDKFWQGSTIKI